MEQNWQNYRSTLNGKAAIFSIQTINDEILLKQKLYPISIQIKLSYDALDNGLPHLKSYSSLEKEIFKITTLLHTIPSIFYAGYTLSDSYATLYFYVNNTESLFELLAQFPDITDIKTQDDPQWDIYFDFLLPSDLELKLHATLQAIELLEQNGVNLDEQQQIEHTFYFREEDDMYAFLEHITIKHIPNIILKHTNTPVLTENTLITHIVKIEQEIAFNTPEIYQYIEQFEIMAEMFYGEYEGWQLLNLIRKEEYLN